MNKLIIPMALAMFSVSMASAAFADPVTPPPPPRNTGYAHSNNVNVCMDAGAGNGGETAFRQGLGCIPLLGEFNDIDPGNSEDNNQAPPVPPGQE